MTQQTDPAEVARVFAAELESVPEVQAPIKRFNIAPTDPLRVVVQRPDARYVETHRWGLVPAWEKKPSNAGRLINARLETVATTPAFRDSFVRRRCIVPADSFYEWRSVGRGRQPFLIHATSSELLAFAGVWSAWRDPATNRWLLSCAVVTGPANATIAQLHDRMPIILPPDAWATWLDPMNNDGGLLRAVLDAAAAPPLEYYPVSPRVNDPRNDGPDLMARVTPDAQPPLTLFG
jgi:putative SOS response-associated peptidase YedK